MADEENTERIPTRHRTVFVLGCVLGVLLIAFLLPFLDFGTTVQDDGGELEPNELVNGSSNEGESGSLGGRNGGENGPQAGSNEGENDSRAGPDGGGDNLRGPDGGVPENFPLTGGQHDYRIEFNRSLVPGSTVRISLLDRMEPGDRTPIEDVPVAANGELLGRTDQFGEVVADVPYSTHFNVTAVKPDYRGTSAGNPSAQPTNRTIEESRELPTEISLTATRQPRPEESLSVTAHVDGVRVQDAPVLVDGERAGQTNANGQYSFRVRRAESTNVTVTRGAAGGQRIWNMAPVTVTVQPEPFSSPTAGQRVTVVATQDGRPVEGATVRLDGERVGSTDEFGTQAVSLPWTSSVTVAVSAGQLETTRKLTGLYGLYWQLGLILLGGLIGIVLLGVACVRFLGTPDSRSFVSVTIQIVVDVVVTVADGIIEAIDRLRDSIAAIRRVYTPTPDGVRAVLLLVVSAVRSWIRDVFARVRRPVETGVWSIRNRGGPATGQTSSPASSGGTGAGGRTDVRGAWSELVTPVVRRPESRPPRELATEAARQGVPERAATTLADAYRDVVYGQEDADEYAGEVHESIAEVRAARSTDGTDGQSAGEGENAT